MKSGRFRLLTVGVGLVFTMMMLIGCPSSTPGPGDGTDSQDGDQNGNGGAPDTVCGVGAFGPTVHDEFEITTDTTWTAADSPHVVTRSVTVRNGATLTIQPCAFLRLDPGVQLSTGIPSLDESGTIVAQGTADQPIKFMPNSAERWKNLRIQHPGSARLAYVTLEGGGSDGITYDGASLVVWGDSEAPLKRVADVDHVTVSGSAGYGMLLARWGAFTDTSTDLTITGSGATLSEFPYPVLADAQLLGTLPPGAYTGNARDEVYVIPRGGIVEDVTLRDLGLPYHIDGIGSTSLTVDEDAILTVDAGVTVRFDPDLYFRFGSNISSGVLRAMGEPGNPVVFTSAAPEPQPGDWVGIGFDEPPPSSTNNILDNVRIEYAGGSCSCGGFACPSNVDNDAAILIFSWLPETSFLTNSIISDCAGNGILRGWEDFTCGAAATDFTDTNTFTNVAWCEQTVPVPASPECQNGCPAVTCP